MWRARVLARPPRHGMAGRAASELRTPDVGADASAGPGRTLPASFQQWCSLASEVLAPAEEIAPFKLGAIKALISDIDRDAGLFVAPAFAVGQVLFLVAFVGYLVTAITALVLDADAATDACARTSWVWLFVLLAAAIPLALGLTVALVKAGLAAGNIKVPAALFSVTGPVCYIVLFVLGVVLWAGMAPECDAVYSRDYFLLHLIFKVQVFVLGIAALLGALTAWGQAVALFAEFETPELPQNFGEFSSLVVTHLAPVEELSPFKLGQIQELMSTVDKDAGDAVAPTFAVAIVFFLLAFVAYFTVAVVALVLDRDALWDSCAKDYWVWLFVLLALAIPTGMGLVMGLVKTALNAANLKKTVGFEIPAVFLALPGPALYIVFGVLGIVIWATMDDECVDWYEGNAMLLLTVFRIQVILFGVAAIIGALTVIAQAAVLISQLASGAQQGGGGEGGRQPDTPAEPPGFQMPEMPKVELPEMPTIEMPKIEMPQMPEVDLGFTFEDFSALVVEKLSPLEQVLATACPKFAQQILLLCGSPSSFANRLAGLRTLDLPPENRIACRSTMTAMRMLNIEFIIRTASILELCA